MLANVLATGRILSGVLNTLGATRRQTVQELGVTLIIALQDLILHHLEKTVLMNACKEIILNIIGAIHISLIP